ncbi:MAG: hypothetical protein ACFB21_00040 [Opitutales bacterium]
MQWFARFSPTAAPTTRRCEQPVQKSGVGLSICMGKSISALLFGIVSDLPSNPLTVIPEANFLMGKPFADFFHLSTDLNKKKTFLLN